MKKIIFFLIAMPIICNATLPEHGLGKDKFVTDLAHALTPEQADNLKTRLDTYEKQTTAEIAVVTISSMADYGYNDIGLFARDLGHEWKIGKEVAHNGIIFVISLKDHKTSIRTGYGSEQGYGSILADQSVKKIKPLLRSGNYYGAISSVIDDATAAISNTDATNKLVIDKETAKREQIKHDEEVAWIGDILIAFLIGILIFGPIILLIVYLKNRKARRAKEYQYFTALKETIIDKTKRGRDLIIQANYSLKRQDILVEQLSAFHSIAENSSLTNISFKEFHSNPGKDILLENRETLNKMVDEELKKVTEFKESIDKTELDRISILGFQEVTNQHIAQYIEPIKEQYKSSILLLNKYPDVLKTVDTGSAQKEIENIDKQIINWKSSAKIIVAKGTQIKFGINAYDAQMGQCMEQKLSIKNYCAQNSAKVMATIITAKKLQTAVDTVNTYTSHNIKEMKEELAIMADHADASKVSKLLAKHAMGQTPQYTGNVLSDSISILSIVNEIKEAMQKCRADIVAAESERQRLEEERIAKEKAKQDAIRESIEAAAILSARNDSYSSSDNSSFGGGDVSGGGANGDW